jgi:hypothetical protein
MHLNEQQDRKLLCRLQVHAPKQKDWYNVSFVKYLRDESGNMGALEHKKRMCNNGDLFVGVNGIHMNGWDGRQFLELLHILLKDKNTTEIRFTMKDVALMEQYRKADDDEPEVIFLSQPGTINATQQ